MSDEYSINRYDDLVSVRALLHGALYLGVLEIEPEFSQMPGKVKVS